MINYINFYTLTIERSFKHLFRIGKMVLHLQGMKNSWVTTGLLNRVLEIYPTKQLLVWQQRNTQLKMNLSLARTDIAKMGNSIFPE